MTTNQKIKVALVQRVCPFYRVPVYRRLSTATDLTLYYGKGKREGGLRNASLITGFQAKRLFTISLSLAWGTRSYFLSLFPSLWFHLWRDRPQVIISEGKTNICNNFLLLPISRLLGVPLLWWDAGRDLSVPASRILKLTEPFILFFLKRLGAVIAYGEMAKRYFISSGVAPEKVFVAYNTVDTAEIVSQCQGYTAEAVAAARRRLGLGDAKVILYVGALERRKRVENLLCAFQELRGRLSSVALLIIGDGPQRDKIEKFIRQNRIGGVSLPGRIVEGLGLYYLVSDVCVQPGWSSLALIEAMACGKPVVAVPYGGPEYEMVENGSTGFLVKRDDIGQLARAIETIISDAALRRRMGEAARKQVKALSLDRMIGEVVRAIEFSLTCKTGV